MNIAEVQHIVDEYLAMFPEETQALAELTHRLTLTQVFNNRSSFLGHGTGGAIVLSPDRKSILMIHHKSLDKWLQPGGHWDPEDSDPWSAAAREAVEETGVQIAEMLPLDSNHPDIPLDLDSHHIPARISKNEPAHTHHDFRYAFLAASLVLTPQEDEVHDAIWVPIDSNDPRLVSIASCIVKLRHFHIV